MELSANETLEIVLNILRPFFKETVDKKFSIIYMIWNFNCNFYEQIKEEQRDCESPVTGKVISGLTSNFVDNIFRDAC